jgi:penicillin amidase
MLPGQDGETLMKKFFVSLGVVALAVVVLLPTYLGSVIWRVNSAEPEWAGQVTVPGLRAPVRVLRNEHGVPHIHAQNELDLAFAQGFVHAQDRFGTMALERQTLQGRLSEWLGPLGVRTDTYMRSVDVVSGAERALAELPESTRAFLEAYSDGVNAWLSSDAYRTPPELIALHVNPEPWEPVHTLTRIRLLMLITARDGDELLRARLQRSDASDDIERVFLRNRWPVFPVIDEPDGGTIPQPTAAHKTGAFSNSWVLSGDHTASGKPLLANDPHLPSVMPGYFAIHRLAGGEIAAAGASMPGIPGLITGHNGAVAWSITASVVDSVDFSLLEVDREDPGRFRRGPEAPWERFERRTETLQVRFGDPVELEVLSTPTGTVWPDALLGEPFPDEGILERRHASLEVLDLSMVTIYRMLTTKSVEESRDAFSLMPGPTINVSMADTSGTIGYVKVGRIWQRPEARATAIDHAPADSNEAVLLDYTENPQVINPASGRIVSGNQRAVGDAYPHYLTSIWAPPDRAMRIHELLDEYERHDRESYLAMQRDVLSPVARRLVPAMLERLETGSRPLSQDDEALLTTLREWDYRFEPETVAPTIFLTWLAAANQRILLDELGGVSVTGPFLQFDYHSTAMVLREGPEAWCDERASPEEETCADTLANALAATRARLTEQLGPTPDDWRWGKASETEFRHPLGRLPLVGKVFSPVERVTGGPEALFNYYPELTSAPFFDYALTLPQYQAIYDLSDLDASLFMGVGGTTGYPGSDYYRNLFDDWRKGERMTLPSSAEDVDVRFELVLEPE